MRKLTFLSLLMVFLVLKTNAQQMTLVEQFTNASCSSCGLFNPPIISFADTTRGVVAIAWQINIPYNWDSMYHDNPSLMNWRRAFYNVSSSPTTAYMGNRFFGSSATFNNRKDTTVANTRAKKAPFIKKTGESTYPYSSLLTVIHDYSFNYTLKADTSIPANYKVYAFLVEKEVAKNAYNPPAGNNSESVHHNVVRQSFFGDTGVTLPAFAKGDTFNLNSKIIETSVPHKTFGLGTFFTVVFVQNTTTKQIVFVDTLAIQDAAKKVTSISKSAIEETKFSIFPNPATDVFTVQFEENGLKQIEIFNLLGNKVLAKESAENTSEINTFGLSKGVYLVQVVQGEKRSSKKLVVE